jgi:hypothetical protein
MPVHGARPVRFLAILGSAIGLLLLPPVFERLFAVAPLLDNEIAALWACSLGVIACSLTLLVFATGSLSAVGAALLFAIIVLIGVELVARAVVNVVLGAPARQHLAWLANGTYPQFMIIKGHPFLHYTATEGNNLGFLSKRDYVRQKPAGTIRVVCLGGSTTADKWPPTLELILNEHPDGRGRKFEVLDFGQNGYSSAHTVVNFFLNAVEFDPDYVILHEGWNDTALRGIGNNVLSDYSNVFKSFEYPDIRDRWLIRSSILYRFLQHRYYGYPPWANIRNALDIVPDHPVTFDDLSELIPFRRNLEKILDFSVVRRMRVILATLPHSTDPNVPIAAEAIHIDQCNDVVRDIHAQRGETILVDLDAKMTGHDNPLFVDLGHLTPEGDRIKAAELAVAILRDLQGQ